jgi:lysozyme
MNWLCKVLKFLGLCCYHPSGAATDAASPIKGIDVSHYQPTVDWIKWKNDGVKFASCKATQGVTLIDSCFKKHYADAKANGLVRQAYHYWEIHHSGAVQANFFWNAVKDVYEKSDLPLCCDFEDVEKPQLAPEDYKANVLEFLTTLERISGRVPMIYTGKWYIDEYSGVIPELAKYPLWLSGYTKTRPAAPKPWSNYDFWQWTDQGGADQDIFFGTLTELKQKYTVQA